MADVTSELSEEHIRFIKEQSIFLLAHRQKMELLMLHQSHLATFTWLLPIVLFG